MVSSQNGWVANDPSKVSSQTVPGSAVKLRVRTDSPGLLLLEVAAAFDRLVQDIDNARGALDDWGYAERPIRGGAELSNHASGTAIDLNATRWPLGASPSVNLSAEQIATVRRIVAVTGGVVRWGGDYSGRKDPMHFEINDGRTLADCDRALVAMRKFNGAAPAATPTRTETEMQPDFPVPDYYTANPNDRLPVSEAIAWGTRHAAMALDAATRIEAAVKKLDERLARLEAKS